MGDGNERLETALRILTKARLLSMQVPAYAVGRWCDAWEDGIRWIVAKIAAGELPPA